MKYGNINLTGNFISRFSNNKTVKRRKAMQKVLDELAGHAKSNGEKREHKFFAEFDLSKLSDKEINIRFESMKSIIQDFKGVK